MVDDKQYNKRFNINLKLIESIQNLYIVKQKVQFTSTTNLESGFRQQLGEIMLLNLTCTLQYHARTNNK